MKRCFKYYNLLLLLACVLAAAVPSACSDEPWADGGRPMEGTPTEITLDFDVLSPRERDVRAAQSVEYEYKVTNLYVMEFDSNGKRVDKDTDRGTGNFFSIDKGNISNAHNKANESDATSSGTISFQGVTGSGMKIVGIANVGTSSASLTMDELNKVETLSDLNRLTTSINAQEGGNIYRGAAFLMTGYAVAGTGTSASTDIDIAYGATLSAKIMLERVDSKITFKVKASNEKYADMKFTPKQWKVVSVPHQTRVMENANVGVEDVITESRDADGTDCTYFESMATKFEETSDNFGSFTFYMYENLKKPKQLIRDQTPPANLSERTDKEWQYACREEQRKTTTATGAQQNLDYKYAPDEATYVQMTGELSYKDGDKYVLADVTYTVHLGYAKQAGPVADDYRTERNSHYTYNITITGVNSLIAEVEHDREERPGAEGDVVISGDEVKTFDSHYCRTKFTLTAEQVSNLIFAVKTPFDNGIQTADGTSEVKDYKWVKFLINSEFGVSESELAAYPGEQCYDGGKTGTGTAGTSSYYRSTYGKSSVTLRDAKQLVQFLTTDPKYKGKGVTVTAFIDEYLYTYNPMTDTYRAPNASDSNLTLWKEGIGHGNRMLHLVPGGAIKKSADGRTTVAHSAMTFVQRPIETIYDVDNQNLKTAWGTEMVNETGVINCPQTITQKPSSGATSRSDGLSNTRTIATSSSLRWASLLSSTDENKMSNTYNSPLYAWALRNRDFDGDGIVDKEEVVWYLASINEMQDLWIGENALSEPLFNENDCDEMTRSLDQAPIKGNATYDMAHYLTSTNASSDPWVYWAEEYGATSSHSEAYGYVGNNGKRRCRFLRHLGLANSSTVAPQTYYTVSGGTPSSTITNVTTNTYTIELSYLNKNAIRKSLDNGLQLPYANLGDAGENNLPSKKFQVAPSSGIIPLASSGTAWNQYYNGSVSFTNGYRMPNQREMILMSNYLDGWAFRYNGWYTKNDGYFTMRNAQKINYKQGNASGYYYGAFCFMPGNGRITRGSYFGATLNDIKDAFYVRPVKDL